MVTIDRFHVVPYGATPPTPGTVFSKKNCLILITGQDGLIDLMFTDGSGKVMTFGADVTKELTKDDSDLGSFKITPEFKISNPDLLETILDSDESYNLVIDKNTGAIGVAKYSTDKQKFEDAISVDTLEINSNFPCLSIYYKGEKLNSNVKSFILNDSSEFLGDMEIEVTEDSIGVVSSMYKVMSYIDRLGGGPESDSNNSIFIKSSTRIPIKNIITNENLISLVRVSDMFGPDSEVSLEGISFEYPEDLMELSSGIIDSSDGKRKILATTGRSPGSSGYSSIGATYKLKLSEVVKVTDDEGKLYYFKGSYYRSLDANQFFINSPKNITKIEIIDKNSIPLVNSDLLIRSSSSDSRLFYRNNNMYFLIKDSVGQEFRYQSNYYNSTNRMYSVTKSTGESVIKYGIYYRNKDKFKELLGDKAESLTKIEEDDIKISDSYLELNEISDISSISKVKIINKKIKVSESFRYIGIGSGVSRYFVSNSINLFSNINYQSSLYNDFDESEFGEYLDLILIDKDSYENSTEFKLLFNTYQSNDGDVSYNVYYGDELLGTSKIEKGEGIPVTITWEQLTSDVPIRAELIKD